MTICTKIVRVCFGWLKSHPGYVYIFLLALILRTLYLILAISESGVDGIVAFSSDTGVYYDIARHFLAGTPQHSGYLFQVGPGYGFILASVQKLFGPSPLFPLGLNAILGSLGAVIICLIARRLTRSMIVAAVAGSVYAVFPTSIFLSCNILSDQPYFTFLAAAILFFIKGLETGQKKHFIISGLLAGLAAYIRGTGQFWPFIFILIPLIIPLQKKYSSRWRMVKTSGLTPVIALLMILAWSSWNYCVHDIFVFGANGVNAARAYLAAKAVADHTEGMTVQDYRLQMNNEINTHFTTHVATQAARYRFARGQLMAVVSAHPDWVLDSFWDAVKDNVRATSYFGLRQIPALRVIWWKLIYAGKTWCYLWIITLTILGWIFLIIDKRHLAWIILGLTYIYSMLITGFSFWQGSRLFYPAAMAWTILAGYAVYRAVRLYLEFIFIIDQHFGISVRIYEFVYKFIIRGSKMVKSI